MSLGYSHTDTGKAIAISAYDWTRHMLNVFAIAEETTPLMDPDFKWMRSKFIYHIHVKRKYFLTFYK